MSGVYELEGNKQIFPTLKFNFATNFVVFLLIFILVYERVRASKPQCLTYY